MPKPWKKRRNEEGADGASTPRTLHTERVVDQVDLHGLTGDEAERRLEMFLQRVSRTDPGEVVRVITGRGAGSLTGPVIQPLVRDALNGWLSDHVAEWAVDMGGGAFLVRVRG